MVEKAFPLFLTQEQPVQLMLLDSKCKMVAEQAAGARAPTQITSYSSHALEQFAGRMVALV